MDVNGYDDLCAHGWGRALLEDTRARFGDEENDDALPRYIAQLNDLGFKRLFGTEMNKGITYTTRHRKNSRRIWTSGSTC